MADTNRYRRHLLKDNRNKITYSEFGAYKIVYNDLNVSDIRTLSDTYRVNIIEQFRKSTLTNKAYIYTIPLNELEVYHDLNKYSGIAYAYANGRFLTHFYGNYTFPERYRGVPKWIIVTKASRTSVDFKNAKWIYFGITDDDFIDTIDQSTFYMVPTQIHFKKSLKKFYSSEFKNDLIFREGFNGFSSLNTNINNIFYPIGATSFPPLKSNTDKAFNIWFACTPGDWSTVGTGYGQGHYYDCDDYRKTYGQWNFYINKNLKFNCTHDEDGNFYAPQEQPTTIEIGNQYTYIGSNCYAYMTQFISVTIPNTIKTIYHQAFFSCTSLQAVYFDGSILEWGNISFRTQWTNGRFEHRQTNPLYHAHYLYCKNQNDEFELVKDIIVPSLDSTGNTKTTVGALQYSGIYADSVYIPNNITKISMDAFLNAKIKIVEFYPGITFEQKCFTGCSGGEKLVFHGTLEEWCNLIFGYTDMNFNYYDTNPLKFTHHLYLNGNSQNEVTSITIPDTITSIGKEQFEGANSITTILLHNNITSISEYAFSGCSGASQIIVPSSVTSLGEDAFNSVKKIIVNANITSIPRLSETNNKTQYVDIPSTITTLSTKTGALVTCSDVSSFKVLICRSLTPPSVYKYSFPIRPYKTVIENYEEGIFVPLESLSLYITSWGKGWGYGNVTYRGFKLVKEFISTTETPQEDTYWFDSQNSELYHYINGSWDVEIPQNGTYWYVENEWTINTQYGNKLWIYTTSNDWHCITDDY